ncbi:type I restriction-modification system endonuclease [Sorangium sp. KYC3313]|uniref:type I restriction-modification system endonuclease n=1 Tax=Sorangium sp. KYC3313 TaxID=3449740 RepID=UPI003F891D9B
MRVNRAHLNVCSSRDTARHGGSFRFHPHPGLVFHGTVPPPTRELDPMPPAASPNFAFLDHHDPRLVVLGTQAERYFAEDPNTCLVKLRQFGEILAQRAAARLGLYMSPEDNQAALIGRLRDRGALDATTRQLFHDLRVAGNKATHELRGDHHEALHQLKMARELAVWFQRSFGNNRKFDPGPFVPPPDPAKEDAALAAELERLRGELARSKVDIEAVRAAVEEEARKRLTAEERARKEAEDRALWEALATEAEQKRSKDIEAFERQKAQLAAELAALQAQAVAAPAAEVQAFVNRAAEAAQAIHLDEAATRRLIDKQLRDAGWEADSEQLHYRRGTRPQKGKNLAIAEWPTETGPVDYALFVGLEAFAVVEAKKMSVDVANVLKQQTTRYSRGFKVEGDARFAGGPWGGVHKVPFLFATNGRAYLKQLETKSGIWFRDARLSTALPRALQGWYTPEGLVALFKQDIDAAHAKLGNEPTGYLDLRDYQIRAIRAVEAAVESGQRACLVAMATGTGKTRTAIGLVYRLIKAQRFRRVLFLVDRSALGEQTVDALKDVRLENLQTFAEIYNIKGLDDVRPDAGTKLHVATIQGMVKRLLDPKAEGDVPPVDQYDCIVVDECHRGYTLDQEMSDVELSFRSLDDYVSRYRRVLDHFDAVKIGLTATPAAHTKEIFGTPVFLYSYREAVIDGCLVDHEPPVSIVTDLARKGMIWKKGEKMRRIDPRTAAAELVDVKDEVKIDVDGFNSKVITESFNEVVCAELARHIDPTLPGKTLIFCVNDAHADLVVRFLEAAFLAQYGSVDEGTVAKITGHPSVDRPLQLIRHFKNERLPNVVVTVDLLTTGVDVPKICNIVFLRQVKSRILYEQMLGRATRLCPQIEKTSFRIFDAVALYENFERLTSMTSVVNDVSLSFQKLVEELRTVKDAEARTVVLEQLIAKLQRKRQVLKGESLTRFEGIAGMTPAEVARLLKAGTPDAASEFFAQHGYLVSLLDDKLGAGRPMIVSEHVDRVIEVGHGYGKAARPDDYLDSFAAYVRDQINTLPALVLVTQRPRDLTREQLRELKLALDGAGYTEAVLRTAWRNKTNADIAASIMGFIRRAALGDALVPYGERVDRAVAKIGQSRAWTPVQRKWLERIGKQIKADEVVDRAALDRGQFQADGGFQRIDKIFDGQLEQVLGDLKEAIWAKAAG